MEEQQHAKLDTFTHYGLIILAVVQGYTLYALHLSIDNAFWPATDLRWLKALYTVAIALPAFFYLGMVRWRDKYNLVALAILLPLLFLLGWHLGWMQQAEGLTLHKRYSFRFTCAFAYSLGIALFILVFFFRTWRSAGKWRFDYPQLLAFSWQHALTAAFLGLFVGVFWLLLFLWAQLFEVLDIDFFEELFEEPFFIYPVTWLVLGLGLVLVRNRIRLIATVQFMCEALIKALLPLAAFIVLLFLGTLPFTGLEPIWDTGHAAALMMLLAAVLLFFFNAVLSEQPDHPPYPLALRMIVFAAVVILPVASALAAWALWLRIDQYGLTVDRLWGAVIQFLLALYTVGYAVLLLWKRRSALRYVQSANKAFALVVVAVLVMVNTPLADLRAWAADSQAGRLLSGEADVEAFDYDYLRFRLGAYGVRKLRELQESDFAEQNPVAAKHIDAVLKQENPWSSDPVVDTDDMTEVAGMLRIVPPETKVPDEVLRLIVDKQRECVHTPYRCWAIQLPSDGEQSDWMVIHNPRHYWPGGQVYTLLDGFWEAMGTVSRPGCDDDEKQELQQDDVFVKVPGPFVVYSDGNCLYQVVASEGYLRGLMEVR